MDVMQGGQAQDMRLGVLFEVVLNIARASDLEQSYSELIGRLKWVLDFDRCVLTLVHADGVTYDYRTLFDSRRSAALAKIGSVPVSQGIPGRAVRECQVLRVTRPDVDQLAAADAVDAALWGDSAQTVLSLPLEAFSQVLGAITFISNRADAYGRDDARIAASVATHLALAIERAQQVHALQQQNAYLAALHATTFGLISRLNINEVLQAIVSRAADLLRIEHGFIFLANDAGTVLEQKVGIGGFSGSVGVRLQAGEGASGQVLQSGEPLLVDQYRDWEHRAAAYEENPFDVVMVVPLKSDGRVIGTIGMASVPGSERRFAANEVDLLARFAELASLALDNARLFSETQEQSRRLGLLNELGQAMAMVELAGGYFSGGHAADARNRPS